MNFVSNTLTMKVPHPDSLFGTFASLSLFAYFLFAGWNSCLPRCDAIEVPNYHQAGDSILPPEPEEPPPEDGRSVYDPEIYNKCQGLPFTDTIPSESQDEEDEGPVMPSYPWRGGGHEPLPLSDPKEEKRKAEVKDTEMIIGYMNCKEAKLDSFEDEWQDLEEAMYNEEIQDFEEIDSFEETSGVPFDHGSIGEDSGEVNVDGGELNEDSDETSASNTNGGTDDTNEETNDADQNFALMKSHNIFGVGANPDFADTIRTNNRLQYRPLQRTSSYFPYPSSVSKRFLPISKTNTIQRNFHSPKRDFSLPNLSQSISHRRSREERPKKRTLNYQNGRNKTRVKSSTQCNHIEDQTNKNCRNHFYGKLRGRSYHPPYESTILDRNKTFLPYINFKAEEHSYVPHLEMQRFLVRPRIPVRNHLVQQFRGVPVDEDSPSNVGDAPEVPALVPDSESESRSGATGIVTDNWDESKPAEMETQGEFTYEMCEQCLPCCVYFFRREHAGVVQYNADDECKPDDRDLDNPSAECRTCHVRRRPAGQGVTLTCYECAGQQGDRGCRLGPRNPETSQYRVSARFFTISSSNETATTATQANSMLGRRPYFFVPQEGMENPIGNLEQRDYEDEDAEVEEEEFGETGE